MAKLNINLIPPELEAEKKQKNRFSATLKISIIFLVVVIGIAAVVLSLRLSQNVILSNINKDLDHAKATLNSPEYSKREGMVITLKTRLDSIDSLLSQDTYASYAFSLITDLAPSDIQLTSLNIDNKGSVKLSITSNNISSLENFFNKIITPESNQNKITSVLVDSLSRGKSEDYKSDLSIGLIGSKAK